ncbi:hypothetical protein NDU88_000041 [Pleurodeles waltl]|uniref:Uncharacterized protein n=1 Tax=Pleurodeles waltl TaxID=8319 RepID=A0AAV7V4M1_PLEWA|nr:hypothetical protein NDU88_000041 [Pleurodeles waltl]
MYGAPQPPRPAFYLLRRRFSRLPSTVPLLLKEPLAPGPPATPKVASVLPQRVQPCMYLQLDHCTWSSL